MKIIILMLLSIIICFELSAQSDYYWYKGEKIPLTKSTNKKFVVLENFEDTIKLKKNNKLKTKTTNILHKKEVNYIAGLKPYKAKSIKQKKYVIVEDEGNLLGFSQEDNNLFVTPYYITNGEEIGVSYMFYVKLKQEMDITILEKIAGENSVEILGNNEFMPLWYTLSCSNESKGNALEMANKFYETDLFEATDIDFMVKLESLASYSCPTNDTYYSKQWSLHGTNGVNYCEALEYTNGKNDVIIAIIDQGINYNHDDKLNLSDTCYDAYTNSPCNKSEYTNHGTSVAEIIGAAANNSKGIAGIAPNCRLMNIRCVAPSESSSFQAMANAINFATLKGASIINMSMGWHTNIQSTIVYDAIHSGRNGLGCVVIFAAGNQNTSELAFPAKSHLDAICVGAINSSGYRWIGNSTYNEGSSYGDRLDIIAPGVSIHTTSWLNSSFTGTSAAAPHVAGIAALMLSINPTLTQNQVVNIIESTAKKVGGYAYQNNISGRPNGSWNNQMGYGLINAGASLKEACLNILSGRNISSNTTMNVCGLKVDNVIISNGANLKVRAEKEVVINSIDVKLGSGLDIN